MSHLPTANGRPQLNGNHNGNGSNGSLSNGAKIDPNDPQVRKLVYNMYRGMLGQRHHKANEIVNNAPKERVEIDSGVGARVESMMRQQAQLKEGGMNTTGTLPPPPPPPIPSVIPSSRLPTEIPARAAPPTMNPPAALAGAMMKDKKPFTYTPGGIDLSEIKSPRMQKRLLRNAQLEGVRPSPLAQQPSPQPTGGAAAPAASHGIAVQVLPMPGMGMGPQPPPQPREPPKPKRNVCGPPPPPPPFVVGSESSSSTLPAPVPPPQSAIASPPTSPPTQAHQPPTSDMGASVPAAPPPPPPPPAAPQSRAWRSTAAPPSPPPSEKAVEPESTPTPPSPPPPSQHVIPRESPASSQGSPRSPPATATPPTLLREISTQVQTDSSPPTPLTNDHHRKSALDNTPQDIEERCVSLHNDDDEENTNDSSNSSPSLEDQYLPAAKETITEEDEAKTTIQVKPESSQHKEQLDSNGKSPLEQKEEEGDEVTETSANTEPPSVKPPSSVESPPAPAHKVSSPTLPSLPAKSSSPSSSSSSHRDASPASQISVKNDSLTEHRDIKESSSGKENSPSPLVVKKASPPPIQRPSITNGISAKDTSTAHQTPSPAKMSSTQSLSATQQPKVSHSSPIRQMEQANPSTSKGEPQVNQTAPWRRGDRSVPVTTRADTQSQTFPGSMVNDRNNSQIPVEHITDNIGAKDNSGPPRVTHVPIQRPAATVPNQQHMEQEGTSMKQAEWGSPADTETRSTPITHHIPVRMASPPPPASSPVSPPSLRGTKLVRQSSLPTKPSSPLVSPPNAHLGSIGTSTSDESPMSPVSDKSSQGSEQDRAPLPWMCPPKTGQSPPPFIVSTPLNAQQRHLNQLSRIVKEKSSTQDPGPPRPLLSEATVMQHPEVHQHHPGVQRQWSMPSSQHPQAMRIQQTQQRQQQKQQARTIPIHVQRANPTQQQQQQQGRERIIPIMIEQESPSYDTKQKQPFTFPAPHQERFTPIGITRQQSEPTFQPQTYFQQQPIFQPQPIFTPQPTFQPQPAAAAAFLPPQFPSSSALSGGGGGGGGLNGAFLPYNSPIGLYSNNSALDALHQMQQSLQHLNSGIQNSPQPNGSDQGDPQPPVQSRSFRVLQTVLSNQDSPEPQGPVHIPNIRQQPQQQPQQQQQQQQRPVGPQQYHPPGHFQQQQQQQHSAGGMVSSDGPKEDAPPEPKKYMGGSIPSRSFKMLQALTNADDASEHEVAGAANGTSSESSPHPHPPHHPPSCPSPLDSKTPPQQHSSPSWKSMHHTPPPSLSPCSSSTHTNTYDSSSDSGIYSSKVSPSYTTTEDSRVYRNVTPKVTINKSKQEHVVNPALSKNNATSSSSSPTWKNTNAPRFFSSTHSTPVMSRAHESSPVDQDQNSPRLMKIVRQESTSSQNSQEGTERRYEGAHIPSRVFRQLQTEYSDHDSTNQELQERRNSNPDAKPVLSSNVHAPHFHVKGVPSRVIKSMQNSSCGGGFEGDRADATDSSCSNGMSRTAAHKDTVLKELTSQFDHMGTRKKPRAAPGRVFRHLQMQYDTPDQDEEHQQHANEEQQPDTQKFGHGGSSLHSPSFRTLQNQYHGPPEPSEGGHYSQEYSQNAPEYENEPLPYQGARIPGRTFRSLQDNMGAHPSVLKPRK